jgi:hypothetical protein
MNTEKSGVIEPVKETGLHVIQATGQFAEGTLDTTASVIGTTVHDTAEIGGEVGGAAKGLIGGVIKGTEELGVEAEHAVAAIAGGALKAAGEVGSAAVGGVRTVFTKPDADHMNTVEKRELAASQN